MNDPARRELWALLDVEGARAAHALLTALDNSLLVVDSYGGGDGCGCVYFHVTGSEAGAINHPLRQQLKSECGLSPIEEELIDTSSKDLDDDVVSPEYAAELRGEILAWLAEHGDTPQPSSRCGDRTAPHAE